MTDSKLKIGVCIDFYYDTIAGAEANSLELARKFREKGHTVEIICSRSFISPRNAPDASFPIRKTAGMYIMREYSRVMPWKLLSDFCYQFPGWLFRNGLVSILKQNNYDVIYTYSYDLVRCLKENSISTPVVFTLLNPIWSKYIHLLDRPNKITCVGKLLQEEVYEKYSIETVYAPPAIDLKKFRPTTNEEKETFRLKFPYLKEKKILLFSNRLIPFKNCENMIRAMPHILKEDPNYALIVLGHGVLEALLKKLSHNLGLDNSIYFLGTVSIDELNNFFNIADLVVVPSFYESCSMVSVEALSARRPLLISSGMDEFRSLFPDVDTTDPNNPYSIAQEVLRVVNASPKKINFENLPYFDLPKLADLYEEIFYEVVKH